MGSHRRIFGQKYLRILCQEDARKACSSLCISPRETSHRDVHLSGIVRKFPLFLYAFVLKGSYSPHPKPVTIGLKPLPNDVISQEQACYTIQRLIHRLDAVIIQHKGLAPSFFGNLISFLRGIGGPAHTSEDVFSNSIDWMVSFFSHRTGCNL